MNNLWNWVIVSDQVHLAIAIVGIVIGIALLIGSLFLFRKRPIPPPGPKVVTDWTWTGHVNAIGDGKTDDDAQCIWKILVEEHRIVSDIADGELIEIRWRGPTRKEMREIVRLYNETNKEFSHGKEIKAQDLKRAQSG